MIPWISFSSYEEYFALWMITTNTLINLQLRYYINLFIILNILLNIFLWNLIYFSSTCTEPWTFCSSLSLNLCAHILWFDIGSALLNQNHLDFHWLLSSVFFPLRTELLVFIFQKVVSCVCACACARVKCFKDAADKNTSQWFVRALWLYEAVYGLVFH